MHQVGDLFELNVKLWCQKVKRGEVVSDSMSSIVLRGSWSNIIFLNVHAPNREKSDDSKDSFYVELKQVFLIIFLNTV